MASDQQRYVVTETLGAMPVVLGALFVAAGAAMMVLLLIDSGNVQVNGRPATAADVWIPGMFALLGLAVCGIRRRVAIDLQAAASEETNGWFRWSRCVRKELGRLEHVLLLPEEARGSGKQRRVVHPVRVVGERDWVEAGALPTALDARALAEQLARKGRVVLRDGSDGKVVERAPHELDQPLLVRTSSSDLAVPRPDGCRLLEETVMGGVRIHSPRSTSFFRPRVALLALIVPGVLWWLVVRPVLAEAASQTLGPVLLYGPLAGLVTLPLLVWLVLGLKRGAFGHTIDVDRSGLRALGKSIAAQQLEELRVVNERGRRCLRAISDDAQLELANDASEAELNWLRSRILRALRG